MITKEQFLKGISEETKLTLIEYLLEQVYDKVKGRIASGIALEVNNNLDIVAENTSRDHRIAEFILGIKSLEQLRNEPIPLF